MMTLESISGNQLDAVNGGLQAPRSAQAAAVCNRSQFDWMAAHMVPDTGLHPGVQHHVVAHDAQMCGFPMPR